MDDNTDPDGVQAFDLIDSLDQEWLKIPLLAVQEVGPAAQTLGGFLKITNKETFVSTATIAKEARVPLRTAEKHLHSLVQHGWVTNGGRSRASNGRPRRTVTRTLTAKCKKNLEPYAILPWWACCFIYGAEGCRDIGKLPWSTKCVLAIVMSRLGSLKAAAQEAADHGGSDDIILWIDTYVGIEERFRFSLNYLERQTGLTRESIVLGKRDLHRLGIIEWTDSDSGIDCIQPRWDFRIVKTPTEPGFFRVSFSSEKG